ncbi:HTTM domain-containing protein [Hymenobacter jeollabukensis]|uniref:HTTM domain-containing protein n=1 Tax=Hymenobacter jeollabukensis TaxID=2025313 RepID=A0A5R8WMI9_9BACT|nr:HTTM domain-containing protein [Hymenobacter jeollabukensis]TLM90603.1 HTTM domain-containing protein [Hymenobacter jeollabukensis]
MAATVSRLTRALFRPVDIAWLVYLRLGAGFLLALEHGGGLLIGRVRNYTAPRFHLRYLGWEWLPHPPAGVIYALYALIVAAGLAVAAGWRYRWAAALLSLGYVALLLLEETEYINHFYLYALLAAVLALLPAHRAASADVRASRVAPVATVPAWMRALILFQVGVVYVFAALAKLNPDWLAARPLSVWLAAKAHYPLVGGLLAHPSTAWLLSYGGLAFDALVVPLLLWRRTRVWGFAWAALFHLSNVVVFGLGTFPWVALLLTSLFFAPDFPRRLPGFAGRWFRSRLPAVPATEPAALVTDNLPPAPTRRRVLAGLAAFVAVQLLLPLRHFLYPADAHWTEEGHRFSWHLMLRAKQGSASFRVRLANGREETVWPDQYLTPNQARKLVDSPDLLLQFAHLLAQDYRRRGLPPVAVYCDSHLSLNGHPARPLVSPRLNLLTQRRGWGHYPWVLPGPGEESNPDR